MEAYIRRVLKDAGIDAGDVLLKHCAYFLEEVWKAQNNLNLTAAKSMEELVQKHLLDSLYLTKVLEAKGQAFLDLGTGAGFPGAPLKFFYEDSTFCFLDAARRKVNFLKYTLKTMDIKNYSCVQGRAEDLSAKEGFAGSFDVVCCRAVAGAKALIELGMPFLRKDGFLVLYKGPGGEEELQETEKLLDIYKGTLAEPFYYNLPGGENRVIFTIRKH